jgi:hypothetical protein
MQMNFMRPFRTMVLLGLWIGGFPACSSALLMSKPVSKTADGWGVTLSQVREGPSDYVGEGGVLVTADTGEKLIWTVVTARNESSEEQTFSYEACVLEGKGLARRPRVVDRHEEINAAADRAEAIPAGQERTRQLIYAFPEEQRPVRMKCENIVLPLPGPR